eukprot:gene8256-9809_t
MASSAMLALSPRAQIRVGSALVLKANWSVETQKLMGGGGMPWPPREGSCAPPSFLSSIMREVPGTLAQGPPVQLIDLQPGSLGSGDTILEKHFGGEIDAHDTVIRYNSPTSENYRRHVGSKTSFLIYKELYRSRGQEEASQLLDAASKPRAYILNQKQVLKHAPRLRFRGRPVLALGPDANKVDGIGAAVYTAYLEASGMSSHIGSKLRRATTGELPPGNAAVSQAIAHRSEDAGVGPKE